MSGKEEDKMEVDAKEAEVEKDKQKDENEEEGEEDDEEEDDDDTPKKPMTPAERRLSRLSSGMEMRGMMTETYSCKECSASFSRKSKLDYHIANAHPKEEIIPPKEKTPKRGRKSKTPQKIEKVEKTPKSAKDDKMPKIIKLGEKDRRASPGSHEMEVQRAIQKQLLQQQHHQMMQQQRQQLHQLQGQQHLTNQQAIALQNKQQSKLPKVTNISNEKVKYNWGYYCTACDMYFANMFAQQFHCLHGQAKFRCEACCICFKLRKNFMSHVQMVHGVEIPEEVLARMRPRSEIRAKADVDKNGQKKQDSETVDLTKDDESSSEKDSKEKKDEPQTGKSECDENESAKSEGQRTEPPKENGENEEKNAENSSDEHSMSEQEKVIDTKEDSEKSKVGDKGEAEVICVDDTSSDKPSQIPQPKAVTDMKQSESGGNSSADESDKKEEGRVYLTTVRMGNTYVTLPSGEKWMIECLRCHQAFFKMEDASVHMKQRPGSHFSCPHCHYSSTLFSQCDYEIHRLRTHSFPCAQCRQSFILECQRDMHEQKIHNYFRQLMRRKAGPTVSKITVSSSAKAKSPAGSVSGNRTLLVSNQGGPSVSKSVSKTVINRDGYPIVRTQRTPYVCLMCDRDCYTRDALEHHKKTFHSAVHRTNSKITHPISKSTVALNTSRYPTTITSRSAPVAKILQEMRQGPAVQDPYLEPNKIPHGYIARIKVDLPDANKLVDTIRNELLKGPSNFSMPNYAKPSKFNKDMVTNPAVVKLSREVAYKLYFDLQGPCNESDKMNYKEEEQMLYKIPMGCHSQKLKDVPLFPTLDDITFRTQKYTVPPVNTIAPVELFAGFKGDLPMKDCVSFAQELDNCMFNSFTKTMRALTMIYSSRRVAVSEGFWRLQTKALIAILKEVEDQRKKEINERAKTASAAAKAAAASAASSARPVAMRHVPLEGSSGLHGVLPNGGDVGQSSAGQPMIQLAGKPDDDTSNVPEAVTIPADIITKKKLQPPHSKFSTLITEAAVPTLQSLAKKATDAKDKKPEEEKMEVDRKDGEKDEDKEEEDEEDGDEPKKKKQKTDNDDDDDEKVLVNGSSSPPPGDGGSPALNGTQNGPTEGGSPANGTSSDSQSTQPSDAPQKATKVAGSEGTPTTPSEPVHNLPNGTMHTATLNSGTFQVGGGAKAPLIGNGIQTPLNPTAVNLSNGGTNNVPLNIGNKVINLNLSNNVGLFNNVPVQIGIKTSGNVGGNGFGSGIIQLGNGLRGFNGGAVGTVLEGIGGVSNGFVGGGRGGGNGLVFTVPQSNVRMMQVPKLAYSVGAVSAVASVQNIPSLQMGPGPITLSVQNNGISSPLLTKPVLANPTFKLANQSIAKPAGVKTNPVTPIITKVGNGVVPEKISEFIRQNFIHIQPKEVGGKTVPIKVEALPGLLKVNNFPASKKDPNVDDLIKMSKMMSPGGNSGNREPMQVKDDYVLTRVLQSIAIIKQLQSSKFLPEELCRRITPLCERIMKPSTTMEDKEDLSKEVDHILKTEAKDALKLFHETKDVNSNSVESEPAGGDQGMDAEVDQFLHNLAKRIKYIQSRMNARTIDPTIMGEIVPMCQDICDPKLALTHKVRCIREIEDKIKTTETETSQTQAATPVDVAAMPVDMDTDEDACVYFKLQLEDGTSVMVNMNDLEDSYKAISDLTRMSIRIKRMNNADIRANKVSLKLRKISQNAETEPANKKARSKSSTFSNPKAAQVPKTLQDAKTKSAKTITLAVAAKQIIQKRSGDENQQDSGCKEKALKPIQLKVDLSKKINESKVPKSPDNSNINRRRSPRKL